jgi:hypothetical protein
MGLAPAAMVPEQGYAYTVALASPHPRLLRLGLGEPQAGARGAALTLIEDGRTLGPAGALHHDIRDQGGGRYALSGAELYFAASDNTDPRSNGRRYSVMVPMALTREAAWAAGLLSGLLLLVCWPTLATLATLASWATARTTAAWTTTVASASRAASVAASLAAAAMARFRPSLAAVAVSAAAGIGVAVGLPMVVVSHPLVIAPASVRPERGYAYTVEIAPPSRLLRLDLSEQAAGPRGAFLTLLENGAKLGPAGALHQDIRDQGAGRYALSHTHLYLSATDNSDPRSNGRRYALVVPMAPSPAAGCVAGLLGAVILLVRSALIRSRRRSERRT